MSQDFKISVLTPSYNSAKHIERAINSVVNQDYKNWEHIIMDGGSTDGTIDVLGKYPHLIWKSEKDNGQSDAMNKAFAHSNGNIIVYLNADDEFNEGIFSKIISLFKTETNCKNLMVITDLIIVDKHLNEHYARPSIQFKDILNPRKLSYPLNPISYFYCRNIQESTGAFPVELIFAMDYWFLLRVYAKSKLIYLSEIAGKFHNYNNKTSDKVKSEIDVLAVLGAFIRNQSPYFFFLNLFWLQALIKKYILKKIK